MDHPQYTCRTCGKVHEGLPDLSFAAPFYYEQLAEPERGRHLLTSDLCSIADEDYFVRGVLKIPIRDEGRDFAWGVWVSLSEKNFRRYADLFDSEHPPTEGPYFGWLSNRLPHYPETLSLKTNVILQPRRQRPLIEVQPSDHPLSVHQREGMTMLALLDLLGPDLHHPVG